MKDKKKNILFACEFTDASLGIVKVFTGKTRVVAGLSFEPISPDLDNKQLAQKLKEALKKHGFNNNRLIVSLARAKVTSRYLKIPTQAPDEIDKIVTLQAARYLPYHSNELVTAYQVISSDKEGCSEINLVIAHKDIIERYLSILRELKIRDFRIFLSSYGISNLHSYILPQEHKSVMVVEFSPLKIEAAVICGDKLFFSRSFKIAPHSENWQDLFIEEIKRTKSAYSKEILNREIEKVVILNALSEAGPVAEVLESQIGLPVEMLAYWERIATKKGTVLKDILQPNNSCASLIGLALKEIPESLNLLPLDLKEANKKSARQNERWRMALFASVVLLIFGFGIDRSLENKELYIGQLKKELEKLEKETKPLEELEKRINFMADRMQGKLSILDMFYEVHRVIPRKVSLVNLSYEEDSQMVVRGQALERDAVYGFLAEMEKSAVFKNFNIKLRYDTSRKVQAGEIIDFEIIGSKK